MRLRVLIFMLAAAVLLSGCQGIIPINKPQSNVSSAVISSGNMNQSEILDKDGENSSSAVSDKGEVSGKSSSRTNSANTTTSKGKTSKPSVSSKTGSSATVSKPTGSGVAVSRSTSSAASGAVSSTVPIVEEPVNKELVPIQPKDYYGRKLLQQESNKNLLVAYERIANAVNTYQGVVNLADLSLSTREMEKAYTYYWDDFPQHFWRGRRFQYSFFEDDGTVEKLYLSYEFNGNKAHINQLRASVQDMVAYLLQDVHGGMSEFEREKAIHDRLVMLTDYDTTLSQPNIYDMYGALINKKAVCEGYARAFQYLMYQAGIQCILVKGTAYDNDNNPIAHAWNVVKIGGEYYQLDATWNDPVMATYDPKMLTYNYFNLTSQEMYQDHAMERDAAQADSKYYTSYPIPNCTATTYNFFNFYNLVVSDNTTGSPARVVAFFAQQSAAYAHIKLVSSISADQYYSTVINKKFGEIIQKANELLAGTGKKLKATARFSTNSSVNTITFSLTYI